jgi:hypothetical protein
MDAPHSTGKRKDRDGGGDDLQAWLASVPLREVAPKKQVRRGREMGCRGGGSAAELSGGGAASPRCAPPTRHMSEGNTSGTRG